MTDIAGERKRLAAQGLRIVAREQWGARFDYTDSREVTRPANDLFLHITITDPSNYSSDAQHVRAVESIGISRFPATGMSYNALCPPSAVLHEGQPLTRRGAHTVNVYEVAICPVHGGSLRATDVSGWNLNYSVRALALCQMLDDPVTGEQIDAAAHWGAACIRAGEVKPTARWHGHRDVTNKDCPGAKAFALIPELQALTEHYVAHGLDATPEPEPPKETDMGIYIIPVDDGRRLVWTAATGARLVGPAEKQMADDDPDTKWYAQLPVPVAPGQPPRPPRPDKITAAEADTLLAAGGPLDEIEAAKKAILTAVSSLAVGGLTDEALAAIAKAVNDEEARRQAS